MVRNVKHRDGFSIVEIMISMVILAIVVMIMSNVIVMTTKSHGKATADDAGDAIALEFLSKLQNKIESKATGDKEITRDNKRFNIHWEVASPETGTGLPSKATVIVTWQNGSRQDTSKIVGYVDLQNVCAVLNQGTAGNSAINRIDLEFATAYDATTGAPTWSSITMPTTKQIFMSDGAGKQIIKVKPIDPNLPNDKMTYSILTSQNLFTISPLTDVATTAKEGVIKTARAFTTSDVGEHTIKIQVFDCSGANSDPTANVIDVTIKVTNNEDIPTIADTTYPTPTNEWPTPTITEHNADVTLPNCIKAKNANANANTIKWGSPDPRFKITGIGDQPTIEITAAADSLMNYEKTNGFIIVPITAQFNIANAKTASATVKYPLKDLPELPTDVKLINMNTPQTSITIPVPQGTGTPICKIVITDEDLTPPNYTIKATQASGKFEWGVSAYGDNILKLALPTASGTTGNEKIKIEVIDNEITGLLTQKTFQSGQLTITFGGNSIPCNGAPSNWIRTLPYVYNSSTPEGVTATYIGRKYHTKKPVPASTSLLLLPNESTDYWQDMGGCE